MFRNEFHPTFSFISFVFYHFFDGLETFKRCSCDVVKLTHHKMNTMRKLCLTK